MSKQSEAILENQLVAQLQKMGYKLAPITNEQDLIENEKQRLARLPFAIRNRRNALLKESDWTQYPDSPLSAEQKQAWATYRQALRDIPNQAGFPTDVQFPAAPN